jgi:hypothetical protein
LHFWPLFRHLAGLRMPVMPTRRPSLTPERRRVLELLASSRHGVSAELLVHGYGLSRRILASIVRAGLAAAKHEVVMAGGKRVEVIRIRITNDGRRVLES